MRLLSAGFGVGLAAISASTRASNSSDGPESKSDASTYQIVLGSTLAWPGRPQPLTVNALPRGRTHVEQLLLHGGVARLLRRLAAAAAAAEVEVGELKLRAQGAHAARSGAGLAQARGACAKAACAFGPVIESRLYQTVTRQQAYAYPL